MAGKGGTMEDWQGVMMIAHYDTGCSVLTCSYMARIEVNLLKDHLDRINGCEPEQLRDLYMAILADWHYSSVGVGGSGIIDIAHKSGHKLEYDLVPLDNENAFFSLNVNVTT